MMPPIFCLDARTVHPHFPGVGRYAANLGSALPGLLKTGERLVILANEISSVWHGTHSRAQIVGIPATPFSLRQQWAVPRLLRRLGVSLYHSPYYLIPFWPGVATVVTLHDLIPLRYPQFFTPAQRLAYRIATRLAVSAGRTIITVSQAAADDITRQLRVPAQRLVVIPEAADPRFVPQPAEAVAAVGRRLGLPARYALYVGSNKPHKNLVRLVEAWARLRPTDVVLLVAGAWDRRFPEARQRATTLAIGDSVRFLGPVSEGDLPALYSGALLFVYPSEYEGFGLPVIEAMACGVPVACSTAASLAEVVADAALRFAADDVEAMAAAIGALLADVDLRSELARRGRARAAQFSWESAARSTLEVYRRALV